MPRLPISTKRPPRASTRKLASMSSPESELSTTSTPRPSVRDMISSANAVLRESNTCATPIARSSSRFRTASRRSRRPRRPRAARAAPPPCRRRRPRRGSSTRSPACSRARWPRQNSAVRKAIGNDAPSSALMPAGRGCTNSGARDHVRGEAARRRPRARRRRAARASRPRRPRSRGRRIRRPAGRGRRGTCRAR